MALNLPVKRWHKITAIVVIVLAAIILIGSIFVNNYWSPILSSKVKEVVAKSTGGLYTVDFSSAELHVVRGTIDIDNLVLKPDTAVYNLRKKQNLAPNNLTELRVKRVILSHIHPFKLYFQRKLEIGEVDLDQPTIHISYQLNHKKDTVVKDRRTAWEQISKSLRSIHIGSILLGDIRLKYEDYSGNKLVISELKEMNISVTDLLIDSATQTDKSRLLYCKDIVGELNNYTGKSPNGLYTYKFNHLRLSTKDSRLNIEGLSLKPIQTDAFFAKSNADRFTMHLDSLQLNNFDYLSYHKYRIVDASRLNLHNGFVEVFSNPRTITQATDRVVTFPHVAIHTLAADLKLDTVGVKNVNIYYTEHNQKSGKNGTIAFSKTDGVFLNLTTRPAALQQNNIARADLVSYFMNRDKLDVHFTFNLTDKDNSFSFKGTLGAMDLKGINSAIRPLTLVKINSGTVKSLDFDIRANRSGASGTVRVLYNNLNISLLKTDSLFNSLQTKPIMSLYANVFIIKHDNPDKPGEAPRVAAINFTRKSDIPFFKFIWQTLLSGLKPEIGLDKKTQDATTAMIKEQAANKLDRQTRRVLRKARRAVRQQKRAEKKAEKAARG